MPLETFCSLSRCWTRLLTVVIVLLVASGSAWATDLYDYEMTSTTGTGNDMSGSTTLLGPYTTGAAAARDIGFDFYLDGQRYTRFRANSAGLLTLNNNIYTGYYSYNFPASVSYYPAMAAFFGRYHYPMSNGKVHFKLSGTAPRRVLTIEWLNVGRYGSNTTYGTRQIRLYEGSNRIEFWYGQLTGYSSTSTSYSGTIGVAASNRKWLSVYGNNFPQEVYQYSSSQRYYSLYSDPIDRNTVYVFSPCEKDVSVSGNVAQGGSEEMNEGDILFDDVTTQRGNSEVFYPFDITNPDNACEEVTYSMSFSGPGAGDYSGTSGNIGLGERVRPGITFTPQGVGAREAVLTVVLSSGQRLTYNLNATGSTRIEWLGDVEEGGTARMANGDELMSEISVNRNETEEFRPFTIRNFNFNPESPNATIRYILDDPYDEYGITIGDQSEIEGTSAIVIDNIAPGGESTPVITFMPHKGGSEYGTGPQKATLTVIADGEERVFDLNGFSVAPAAEFFVEDSRIAEGDGTYFRGVIGCVGETATSLRLNIVNVNKVDVEIDAFDVYAMDSRIRQGTTRYPLETDMWGGLVDSRDYIVASTPEIAPTTANDIVRFPMTLEPGESRTVYLTFVSQFPGKRYARVFMRSNAVNFYGMDTDNFMAESEIESEPIAGMVNMEFFGRGIGGSLAKDSDGGLNGLSLTFDPVKVGSSVISETTLHNSGECDLRIAAGDLRAVTGDVNDFELVEIFSGMTADADGDYVLAPGASGVIKAKFTPSRSGSRRAAILVRTNDSTLYTDGITERGIYYLNLYGVGKADLRVRDMVMRPAVIDGPGSTGTMRVNNTSTEVIEVTDVSLSGPNTAEIMEDASNPWPAMPITIAPGESLKFALMFDAASASAPGVREVSLDITYGDGETVSASIFGEAGTRELLAAPASLFDGVEVPVGQVARQIAIVSNTGTFPVQLSEIAIEGDGADAYRYLPPARMQLDPGATEFMEITYAPTASGESPAMLVVRSNATNGDMMIMLGASAAGTTMLGDPSGSTIRVAPGQSAARRTGGVELSMSPVVPNPARGISELNYNLPGEGEVTLALYDANGKLVRTLQSGVQTAGSYSERVDVSDLASGRYVVVLSQNGDVVTGSISVVK